MGIVTVEQLKEFLGTQDPASRVLLSCAGEKLAVEWCTAGYDRVALRGGAHEYDTVASMTASQLAQALTRAHAEFPIHIGSPFQHLQPATGLRRDRGGEHVLVVAAAAANGTAGL